MMPGMTDYPKPQELGQVLPHTMGDSDRVVLRLTNHQKIAHNDRLLRLRNLNNVAKTDNEGQ